MPDPSLYEAVLQLKIPVGNGCSRFAANKFLFRALPSNEHESYLLHLQFPYFLKEGSANPDEEVRLVAKYMSLFCAKPVYIKGSASKGLEHALLKQPPGFSYDVKLDEQNLKDFDTVLTRVSNLDSDLAHQFFRACNSFSVALEFLYTDPTLASLLLVVAAECLSSQDAILDPSEYPKEGKTCERYCQFVRMYATDEACLTTMADSDIGTELLKTAYFAHRSAFLHGGREVSAAVSIADKAGRDYFRHSDYEGKQRRTPSNTWLLVVTRSAILNSILNLDSRYSATESSIEAISREKAKIKVVASRDIKAGEAVNLLEMDID